MPGEWWDKSWGIVEGCTPVSRGCDHCWARAMLKRFGQNPHEVRTFPERLEQPLHWRKPQTVFVAPRGDLFHEDVPDEFIEQAFMTMTDMEHHTFLVLTKHGASGPKPRLLEWERWAYKCIPAGDSSHTVRPYFAPNIYLGVSLEDQESADERIPILLDTPAAKRFVSAEPLLDHLDLSPLIEGTQYGLFPGGDPRLFVPDAECCTEEEMQRHQDASKEWDRGKGSDRGPSCATLGNGSAWTGRGFGLGVYRFSTVDWLVTAPESGPGRRPCDLDWVRSIIGQCKAAGVPCMVKHWYFPHWYHGRKPMSLPLLDGRRQETRP